MIGNLAKWEATASPAVSIESTDRQHISVFWGALIPAIPDLISLEQARSGATYEIALTQLLQSQQRWIQHNGRSKARSDLWYCW
jgi:hypothetical protein